MEVHVFTYHTVQIFPVIGPSISIIGTNELFRGAAPVMRHFDALHP